MRAIYWCTAAPFVLGVGVLTWILMGVRQVTRVEPIVELGDAIEDDRLMLMTNDERSGNLKG